MISFLGSEIGRGHAFYLDGLERALRAGSEAPPASRRSDVFAVSQGVSRRAWEAVRGAYLFAGRGTVAAALYRLLRGDTDYNRASPMLWLLGRDVRRWAGEQDLLVVDHPALAGALGSRGNVWYMHGEMVAPREAAVRSAARILVPLEETADELGRRGVDRSRVLVTGICVEGGIVPIAADAVAARRARLAGEGPLTVAFFSSGAEPSAHVATLAAGACAVARHGPHRAIVFVRQGGRLATAVSRESARSSGTPEIVEFGSRGELDLRTAERFPGFDLVVSPPHERSNWAVALGLPMLLVGPDLGPFAPRNRALLRTRKVAVEIETRRNALALPARIDRLRREGILLAMSERGTGPSWRGFEVGAKALRAAAGGGDS